MISSGTSISSSWQYFWAKKKFRIQFLISLSVIVTFGFTFPYFFDFIESRRGKIISDPLIELLPAADVSWLVFALLYFGVITWLFTSLKSPDALLAGFQTYCLVTILRMCTITLFPLEPPVEYIPLKEPFVQLFTTGNRIISRDLFFSGHMTSILVCYFNIQKGGLKKIYFYSAIAIGILLMVQRVHFAIDIIAAPVFTYLCFLFVKKFLAKNI